MAVFDSLPGVVERVAQATGTTPRAVWFVAAMVLALTIGTGVRVAAQWLFPTPRSASLLASLRTWWALIAALLMVTALGRTGVVLAIAVISVLGLREMLALLPKEWVPRPVAAAAFFTFQSS